MTFLEELKWRESLNQTTDENELSDLIESKKINAYVGVDPTAGSIHIGHLIPLTILRRLQLRGHKPVIVVGGGTGMIGDPSGKKDERKLLSEPEIEENVSNLKKQFVNLFGQDGFEIVNNKDWLGGLNLIDFLRDYGKLFPINVMLKRDVVASRLEKGISFTEFTYQILQAIDFFELYKNKNVQLQIGGSDQFGNISSGVELIHKIEGPESKAYGLTAPLLLKSDGTKFGKSEGGTIWLDSKLTSAYQLFQFFMNQTDEDVIRLVKIYTFANSDEIEELSKKVENEPEKRQAQKFLASEVVRFVHGDKALRVAENITSMFFGEDVSKLTADDLAEIVNSGDLETFEVLEKNQNIVDLLVSNQVVENSKRQAREDISNGAISINGNKINDTDATINIDDKFDGKYILVKKGKRKFYIGIFK